MGHKLRARVNPNALLNSRERKILAEQQNNDRDDTIEFYLMLSCISLNRTAGLGKNRLDKFLQDMFLLTTKHARSDEVFVDHLIQECDRLGVGDYFRRLR